MAYVAQLKQSVAVKVPVILVNATTGAPTTGVVFGDVTCAVEKADGTVASVTVLTGIWSEVTTGAFSGAGLYTLTLPASALSQTGNLVYAVKVSGSTTFLGIAQVVAYDESDLSTAIDGVQTTVDSTATQAGLDAVNQNIAELDARVQIGNDIADALYRIQYGRWKIHASGPDANRLVIYDEDGTTPYAKFNLIDVSGDPTYLAVFERVPV